MSIALKNHEALDLTHYRETLQGVKTQFALVRFALDNLPKTKLRSFRDQIVRQHQDAVRSAYDLLIEKNPSVARVISRDMVESNAENVGKALRRRNRLRDLRFELELTEDRLNQSELLLLVAHFESFMKLVHRGFLEAAPHKVFGETFGGSQDPQVKLKELFDPRSATWDSREALRKLVEREVKWLDQQAVNKRAEYFAKHFKAPFGSKETISKLGEIQQLRNRVTHEVYAPRPIRLEDAQEQPLVSDDILRWTRLLFVQVPEDCFKVGAKAYPSHFADGSVT